MPESLSHLAYLALEKLIVTHVLAPGAVVTEKQLIDISGHGRTPVREAIQKLAWQGLMTVRPRVGLTIAEIGADDHDRVMQVRRALEPLAAALVATHANVTQRSELVACAQAMTACAVTGDIPGFLIADKMFDEIMEEACPNRFLTTALNAPQTHARRIWFASATNERLDQSVSLHVAVIRNIQQKDADGAGKAMENLIGSISEKLEKWRNYMTASDSRQTADKRLDDGDSPTLRHPRPGGEDPAT